jgi:hypothetical protein
MSKRRLTLNFQERNENVKKKCRESNNNLVELNKLEGLENVESYLKSLIASYNRDQTFRREKLLECDVIEIFSQYLKLIVEADAIDFSTVGSALLVATEYYSVNVDSLVNESHKLFSVLQRGTRKPQCKFTFIEES